MPKINKPYKCMYCGERYSTLSHVSICPCDKFSNIPPSENTSNKSELVGVTASVGDALFTEFELEILLILINTEIDLDNTDQALFPLYQLKSIQKKLLSFDTDIPNCFKYSPDDIAILADFQQCDICHSQIMDLSGCGCGSTQNWGV